MLMTLNRQVLESGRDARQYVPTTIEGKTFMVDLTIEPLRDPAGAVVGITCVSLFGIGRQGVESPEESHKEKEKP